MLKIHISAEVYLELCEIFMKNILRVNLNSIAFQTATAQKVKFFIKETADLVTFTGEVLNGKLIFCAMSYSLSELEFLFIVSNIGNIHYLDLPWEQQNSSR